MKTTTKAHVAVLSANLFFAANYSLVKFISPKLVLPFAVNVLRVGGSVLLFWLIWLFGNTPAKIKKKDIGRFLLCAIAGIAINQTLFIKGLTMTSAIHASLLILITPIIVTVFALWVLKEKFTLFKAAGLVLGTGGAIFLIMQKEAGHHASNYLLGDIFILCNAVFYAAYFILVKPLMQSYSPLHVMRWIFTLGFFLMLPFGWHQTAQIDWSVFHWQHVTALLFIVLTGTFLAYYFNAYGIQHIGAGPAGTYIYTQPVFAVLIALFFLGESLSWQKILSACLIFSGVYLVNFRKTKTA